MLHLAAEVGLKLVDLSVIAEKPRAQTAGFTAAECKRLLVPVDAEVFQDANKGNAWVIAWRGDQGLLKDRLAKNLPTW